MAQMERNIATRPVKKVTASHKTEEIEVTKALMETASPQQAEEVGVRPSVAASLRNSIEKNAAVWTVLANH